MAKRDRFNLRRPVKVVATDYVATTADCVLLVDASGGDRVITLPLASTEGLVLWIIKSDTTGNTVTAETSGADTLESTSAPSATSLLLAGRMFIADGVTGWRVSQEFF